MCRKLLGGNELFLKLSLWRNKHLISTVLYLSTPWAEMRGCCPSYFLISTTSLLSSPNFLFGLRQAARGNFLLAESFTAPGSEPPGRQSTLHFHWDFTFVFSCCQLWSLPCVDSHSYCPLDFPFLSLLLWFLSSYWPFIDTKANYFVFLVETKGQLEFFTSILRITRCWVWCQSFGFLILSANIIWNSFLFQTWALHWGHLPIWLVSLCSVIGVFCF